MSQGVITRAGRILTARLLLGERIDGLTHCALGDGDATFSDPLHPPAADVNQTALRRERIRKRFYKRTFLIENAAGGLLVNATRYTETATPTNVIAVFFRFEEDEANGITIKEYGFFGGDVAYVAGIAGEVATGGVLASPGNPTGQVLRPGVLYEVKNIPDFSKTPDTRLELVGIIKI
jgi:hypothetical protein